MWYDAWEAFFAYMRQRTVIRVADSIEVNIEEE